MSRKFNTGRPLGYFITWTSYGTWLPGDERGWQRKRNERQLPNPLFEEMARSTMTESEFRLSPEDRGIVVSTIRRHCVIRNWQLHAVDARSNHVHVVVTAASHKPDVVRRQLKAWCTRKLREVHRDRGNFWAEGGSQRWLNTEEDLANAVQYVAEAQDP